MLLTVHVQVDLAKRPAHIKTGAATAVQYSWCTSWLFSTRTVIRRLHHQGMRVRRPIKRPQLTLHHRHARFDWSHDHLRWTIRTWRRVHWSGESRFLLCPTDGRARFGANETFHFRTTTFWAQLLLRVGVYLSGAVFPLTVSWTCTFLMVI